MYFFQLLNSRVQRLIKIQSGSIGDTMNVQIIVFVTAVGCVVPSSYATEFRCKKHPNLEVWEKGDLIYQEDFDSLDGWRSEGNVTISNPNGSLKIQTFGSDSVNKGNVWSLKEFEGPYYIEWKFKEVDSSSLNRYS